MKVLVLLLISLCAIFCNAQFDKFGASIEVFNPTKDVNIYWFNIDYESIDNHNVKDRSIALGTKFYYNLNNESQVRLRVGATFINIDEYQDITPSGYNARIVDNGHGEQIKIHVAPGFGWNFTKNQFQIVGGFEIPFNYIGKFKFHWDYSEYYLGDDAPYYDYDFDLTIPSGFSVGVGAYFGFVYNFKKVLSVGAEFAPSLLYGHYGGKVKMSDYYSPYQWEPDHTIDEYKGGVFNENRFALNLYFRIK